jgi:hypothetical protein
VPKTLFAKDAALKILEVYAVYTVPFNKEKPILSAEFVFGTSVPGRKVEHLALLCKHIKVDTLGTGLDHS